MNAITSPKYWKVRGYWKVLSIFGYLYLTYNDIWVQYINSYIII